MKVLIPSPLLSYTKVREVQASGATLGDLLLDLERQYPGIRFRMVDEQGNVRPHIKLFVDSDVTRDLASPIPSGATLMIVAALSGG